MYSMSRLFFLCLLLSLFAALIPAQNANAPEESKIRQVIQQYLDARERRDSEAVAAVFTPDADQLVSSGEWRKGRDAVWPMDPTN
jgi:putative lumazine-binding protein